MTVREREKAGREVGEEREEKQAKMRRRRRTKDGGKSHNMFSLLEIHTWCSSHPGWCVFVRVSSLLLLDRGVGSVLSVWKFESHRLHLKAESSMICRSSAGGNIFHCCREQRLS